MLPEYIIKKVDKGYVIVRPDGTYVNETIFKKYSMALARLETYRMMGYCK